MDRPATGYERGRPSRMLVLPFPQPGSRVRLAYTHLHQAVDGTAEQKQILGAPADLPRPWDPGSCRDPDLRRQLWDWLEEVVLWVNHEHTWDPADAIPACWARHAHLVHDIATLADQRRRAALATTSDPLEDWHRYALPAFTERFRTRVGNHCEEGHQPWPGRGRYTRSAAPVQRDENSSMFNDDHDELTRQGQAARPSLPGHHLTLIGGDLVDLSTGEVHHPRDPN